tara:strand:- start:3792 stop:4022 length:231 start_codon:yes stop_codon:yes gene_type:complete
MVSNISRINFERETFNSVDVSFTQTSSLGVSGTVILLSFFIYLLPIEKHDCEYVGNDVNLIIGLAFFSELFEFSGE